RGDPHPSASSRAGPPADPGGRGGLAPLRSSERPEECESEDGVFASSREGHGVGVPGVPHQFEVRAQANGGMEIPLTADDPYRERCLTAQHPVVDVLRAGQTRLDTAEITLDGIDAKKQVRPVRT